MCDGASAVMAISALVSAGAAYQQGQNQQEIYDYNADVAKAKADDTVREGVIAEDAHRAKVRQIEGAQRAAMGASGGAMDAGTTFGDLQDQTTKFGELDALTIRSNALKAAWGLRTQAAADQFSGSAAAQMGALQATGSLLSGAAGIYKRGADNDWWSKGVDNGIPKTAGMGVGRTSNSTWAN